MSALFLGCFVASNSAAELVERDLNTLGDGAVTYDSLGGFEWLDLTLTTDLSYDDITQGGGNTWVSDGWRYATSSEVCALFDTYGATPTPCPRLGYFVTEAPTQTVLAMQALFGVTDVLGPGQQRAGGFFDDGSGNGLIGWASITQNYFEPKDGFEVELDDISLNDAGPLWGNFLVRYVPEPSLALLQGVGLLGVGFLRAWRAGQPAQDGIEMRGR
jgi:hypothetical protein